MENRVVSQSDLRRDKQPLLPILSRLSLGFSIYAFQLLGTPILWWRALYPPKIPPVTIKKYNCRPSLPIRYDNLVALNLLIRPHDLVSSLTRNHLSIESFSPSRMTRRLPKRLFPPYTLSMAADSVSARQATTMNGTHDLPACTTCL